MRWAVVLVVACGCRYGFTAGDLDAGGDAEPEPVPTAPVSVTVAGSGTVEATIDGVAVTCSSACTWVAPVGARVVLTATPAPATWFRGWTSTCDGRLSCELVVGTSGASVAGEFVPQPNRIFMSSATIAGNFQTSGTGDALCNQLAATAGLDGTYRVLHSTATTPWTNIAPTARGWIRPDGMPVADQLSDLSGPTPAAISLTETGALVSVADRFWAPHTAGCQDWTTTQATLTGRSIDARRGSNYQSGGGDYACDVLAHVICLGVDRNVAVDPVRETGRRAFTTEPWSASLGLAAADGWCTSEATAAGLPGTFRALLAMPGASAISRFDLTRGRWSRVDGVPMLPTAAAWATATDFDAAPSMTATGADTYYRPILMGAPDFGTPGTIADTCNGWSDAAGQTRWSWFGWDRTRVATPTSCAATNTLVLCLQE